MAIKRSTTLRWIDVELDGQVEKIGYRIPKLTPILDAQANVLFWEMFTGDDNADTDVSPEDMSPREFAEYQLERARVNLEKVEQEPTKADWYRAAQLLEKVEVMADFVDDETDPASPVVHKLTAENVLNGSYPFGYVLPIFMAVFRGVRPKLENSDNSESSSS